MIVNPYIASNFLSLDLKEAIRAAVYDKPDVPSTYPDANGVEVQYAITLVNQTYNIKTLTTAELLDSYAYPSATHVLGLDANGMDVLTRLMYGGRISLMVGFVVIFFELIIGVIIGGIAGYFGGWVDTAADALYRPVQLHPVLADHDHHRRGDGRDTRWTRSPELCILMLILGLMGWTGIARIVRGQILSLREQDFMVAAEATGIRVSQRASSSIWCQTSCRF